MKFILGILLTFSILFPPHVAHAAIASNAAWEIRSTATPADVNGGCYVAGSGTPDYSQQDTAQYSLSGGTSSGAGAVILTASAASDMVGNCVHVISGTNTTTGWYYITAESPGVSITLDRNVTTGVGSSIVFKIGGAMSMQSSNDSVWAPATQPGNVVWVKAGTYNQTSNYWSGWATCTFALPCALLGYNTTRGDTPTGNNRPFLNFVNSNIIGNSYWTIANFNAYSTNGNSTYGVIYAGNSPTSIVNCRMVNASLTSGVNASGAGVSAQYIDDEFVSYNGWGIQISATAGISVVNSYFHDSMYGIYQTYGGASQPIISVGNTFENMGVAGIYVNSASSTGNYTLVGNTFYGGESTKTGIGIDFVTASNATRASIYDNIFYGLSQGVHSDTTGGNQDLLNNNDFYNNTTDVTNVLKGSNDLAVNPNFKNVGQYSGTTATSAGSVLTDSGANFANVTNNVDNVYVISGTGVTVGFYGITGHTGTTLTTDLSLGTHATGDIHYVVIYGHNLTPTNTAVIQGPGLNSPNINSLNYRALGSVTPQYTDPGVAVVKKNSTYIFGGATETGTLVGGFPKRPGGKL